MFGLQVVQFHLLEFLREIVKLIKRQQCELMQDIPAPEKTKYISVLRNEIAVPTEKGEKQGQQRKVALMG